MYRYLSIVIFLSLLTAVSFALKSSSYALINGVGAKVADRLLTIQDAQFYHLLLQFNEGHLQKIYRDSDEHLRKAIQKWMFNTMVAKEIESLKISDDKTFQNEIKDLQAKARKHPLWTKLLKEFSHSESEAMALLTQAVRADRYVERKIATLALMPSEDEMQRYWTEKQGKNPTGNYQEYRPKILLELKKQKMEKALEEWVVVLRERFNAVQYWSPKSAAN